MIATLASIILYFCPLSAEYIEADLQCLDGEPPHMVEVRVLIKEQDKKLQLLTVDVAGKRRYEITTRGEPQGAMSEEIASHLDRALRILFARAIVDLLEGGK